MADCFINGHLYGPKQTCVFCGADSGTRQPLMELRQIALGALNDPIDPQTPMYERDLVVQAEVLLKLIDHYIDTTKQPHPDTSRLDKLPQCFHMLRRFPGANDPRQPEWWLTYAPNNVYNSVRAAIDAHQEPKP